MNPKNDAFGQEMLAHLLGNNSYEIIERDDGYIDISDGAPTYFADFDNWPKIEKQAINLAKGRVLDVGTGAGRVALYLQETGKTVKAIDNSPLAIQVCKERGVKDAQIIPIENIKSFEPKTFDSIVMFGNNFGLFGDRQKAKKLLKTLYQITSPNAVILAESNNPYGTEDELHLAYHERNKKNGRMAGQIRFRVRYRNYAGEWFDYLLVSPEEMTDIVESTGWKIREFIQSEGSLYIGLLEKE